jgi:pyruvate kinase
MTAMRTLIGPDARLICKIESPMGLRNLESIVACADAILIDRGDLSRRVPIEKVPFLQRKIRGPMGWCWRPKPPSASIRSRPSAWYAS